MWQQGRSGGAVQINGRVLMGALSTSIAEIYPLGDTPSMIGGLLGAADAGLPQGAQQAMGACLLGRYTLAHSYQLRIQRQRGAAAPGDDVTMRIEALEKVRPWIEAINGTTATRSNIPSPPPSP